MLQETRKNNMAKTLKFLCGLVLFVYLFFIKKDVAGNTFLMADNIECDTDAGCPKMVHHIFYKCIDNKCKQFRRS